MGNFRAFQANMINALMDSMNFAESAFTQTQGTGIFSSNVTANALFGNLGGQSGNLEDRLKTIQDQGMGKVLAAQLANRIPDFGFQAARGQQGRNANESSMSGLNNMISLSIQAQMIKARATIENQFVDIQSGIIAEASKTDLNLSAFIADIHAQIDIASAKYGMDEEEIKRLL